MASPPRTVCTDVTDKEASMTRHRLMLLVLLVLALAVAGCGDDD
jgi:hypothetical protein